MKKFVSFLATLAALCIFTPNIQAGTTTTNLNVSVTVDSACIVSATGISFADYAPLGSNLTAPRDGNGSITLTCTAGVDAIIALDGGGHNLAGQNRMISGSSFINYALYQDTSRTIQWGTGVAAMTLATSTDTSPRSYTVYGRVPAAQSALSGAYSDIVQVAVNF